MCTGTGKAGVECDFVGACASDDYVGWVAVEVSDVSECCACAGEAAAG